MAARLGLPIWAAKESPEHERRTESLKGVDIRAEIDRLRKERNAVILAH